MNRDRGQKRSTGRQRWLTDFLLPEDTSTPKRWFLLDDEHVWIHKQWSQLFALLTRDRGKTSEAVSGSMAIKPTQGLCFPLLLAYCSYTGFLRMYDQTNAMFLKYYYNRRGSVKQNKGAIVINCAFICSTVDIWRQSHSGAAWTTTF